MKHTTQRTNRIVAALILAISSMAFLYAHEEATFQRHHDAYLGVSSGTSKISDEDAPFASLALGTEISNRAKLGVFGSMQLLSDFPSSHVHLDITAIPSAFTATIGAEMDIRMFADAAFNPMVHFEVGHMTVAHMSTPTETEESQMKKLGNSFYSSVGTGLELNFFRNLSIVFLHGYRYVPNEAIEDIPAEALSGSYNAMFVKVFVD